MNLKLIQDCADTAEDMINSTAKGYCYKDDYQYYDILNWIIYGLEGGE